jgi:F-type H+-transporting ATPase subunit delta
MSAFRLSTRYAKSLIELALERNQLEEVNNDMKYLQEVIKQSRDFRLLLKSPVVNVELKNKIFEELFGQKVSVITMTFLRLMIKKRREEYLTDVICEFIEAYNKHKKITRVFFTTAVPVDEEVLNRLRKLFMDDSGASQIELHTNVDEDIIGGYIFKYEDKMFDGSIRRQLEKMDDSFLINPYIKKFI